MIKKIDNHIACQEGLVTQQFLISIQLGVKSVNVLSYTGLICGQPPVSLEQISAVETV